MPSPHERLGQFLDELDISRSDFARRLECSDVMVGYVLAGTRVPGTGIAQAIERETAAWDRGPIRTEEWAEVDDQRRRARKAKGAAA